MGLRYRTLITEPSMFLVTITTINHAPFFNDNETLRKVKECLLNVCKFKRIKLFAYVIMSTHIHFLVFLENGGLQLSRLISSVKGMIRKELVGNRKLWTHRFDDKVIESDTMMRDTINYIHNNPVKAGLAECAIDYRFSSALIWEGIDKDSRITTDLTELSTTEG